MNRSPEIQLLLSALTRCRFADSISERSKIANDAVEALAKIEAPTSEAVAEGWISVTDRMPSQVLDSDDAATMVLVNWRRDSRADYLSQIDVSNTVYLARNVAKATHWMPLPQAPGAQPAADPAPVPAQGIDHAKRAEGGDNADEHAAYVKWLNSHEPVARPHLTPWNAWQARGQQAGVPEGCVIVPKEPAQAMIDNICAFLDHSENDARIIYRAMLAAAPGEAG